ncbi:outer membrane protein assembly factor BamE [Gammaproteobacteria bacterium]|nr:outer membrane protein assembly factor BamE [Gammaproteobacteria bacterium]
MKIVCGLLTIFLLVGCQDNTLQSKHLQGQRNFLSLEKKLKIGTTKNTVANLVGPPIYVDPTQDDIWFYLFSMHQDQQVKTTGLKLTFVKGKLKKIEKINQLSSIG